VVLVSNRGRQQNKHKVAMVRQRKQARMESKSSSSEAPTLLEQLQEANEEIQAANERMARMEEETQAANERMARMEEETQAANERMARMEEETQAAKEKTQAANERMARMEEETQAANERMARMEEETQAAKEETQRLRESFGEPITCPQSKSCLSLSFICFSCQEFHGFPWLLRRPLPRRMLSSRTILSSHQPLTF
jgi:chromosome segregation ATPase